MEKRLAGKVAIVTGASAGIGKVISIELAKEGATVVLAARGVQKLNETAEQITALGGKVEVVPTDVADEDSIKALVAETGQRLGRLDILVNNAGIVAPTVNLEETATADWDRCFQVNSRGPFILCRESLPLLRKASAGYIINIASVVGVKGYPLQSAYTASKHALRGMSMSLAEELRASAVKVCVVCPGGVATELVGKVRPDIKADELIAPEEIAELVVYLVTHKGNGVIDEFHIRRANASPWF